MRVETLLGVALVVVSIGNYILYTGLQSKITKLENSLICSEASAILYEKRLNETAVKCAKLERRCSYLETDAEGLHFELTKEDSKWKTNK